ncbi:hypothetical protein HK097_007111 [Rhizophlyctis rosea]|uniref:PARG catalytic Macro domain-containing protein n=1 Tax=Rhizophlyctis rosea TaxID=64517 RepID=A0AAD5SLV6_9FUNG|nr:hypothetical protein HK097_007111 [Rhizophlyctis rosea]
MFFIDWLAVAPRGVILKLFRPVVAAVRRLVVPFMLRFCVTLVGLECARSVPRSKRNVEFAVAAAVGAAVTVVVEAAVVLPIEPAVVAAVAGAIEPAVAAAAVVPVVAPPLEQVAVAVEAAAALVPRFHVEEEVADKRNPDAKDRLGARMASMNLDMDDLTTNSSAHKAPQTHSPAQADQENQPSHLDGNSAIQEETAPPFRLDPTVAFQQMNGVGAQRPLSTRAWGCGVFGGNPAVMAMIQYAAARIVGIDALVYHAKTEWKDIIAGRDALTEIWGEGKEVTIGDLLEEMRKICAEEKPGKGAWTWKSGH